MKERVQTAANALIAVIIALMTALFSVFGWTLVNHKIVENDQIILLGAIIGSMILIALLIFFVFWFLRELKKLEDIQ